ncbi:hypothetical protein [Halogeometricum luteum]|uniref:Uncharacterized protein n=1 Tax=Halogeometricum luteum TaxID=2950537 RepID=A0ABU2G6I5_9EURY|nr:hypothetical protein [Halogeometricum sp. S3BR5-2]MDS0295763.1 hypothetical protein [Halogeometricum sp. S3BR5-2]
MTSELDAADRAVLVALRNDGPVAPSEVRAAVRDGVSTEAVEERLSRLAEGGLVETDGDGYELTPSGRRLLRAESDDGASRPDVPATVEQAIEGADHRPDVEDALARAAVFLRNWGSATADEIVDAVYSEVDAEYDDGGRWWDELVRDPFGSLPGVVPPSSEGGEWRYDESRVPSTASDADEASNENCDGSDGRQVLGGDDDRFGSAKHALEREATDGAEETAFAAAFEALVDADGATAAELAERAAAETEAGSSVDPDRLVDALESVPGVRREGERLRYDRGERYSNDEESTGE